MEEMHIEEVCVSALFFCELEYRKIMESEARVECCVGARVCIVWYDIVEAKCARGAEEKREKHEKSTRAFWFLSGCGLQVWVFRPGLEKRGWFGGWRGERGVTRSARMEFVFEDKVHRGCVGVGSNL